MLNENNPSNAVPGAEQNVPAAGGNENVSETASLKDIINNLTGRTYVTDEEAAKGLQNTYQMVGKKVEPQVVEKVVVPDEFKSQLDTLTKQLAERDFYDSHPELKPHKDLLSKFGNPEEALKDETVKKVIGVLQASADAEKNTSVLNQTNRLAVPSDDYEKALSEAKASGNWTEFLEKYKGIKTIQ